MKDRRATVLRQLLRRDRESKRCLSSSRGRRLVCGGGTFKVLCCVYLYLYFMLFTEVQSVFNFYYYIRNTRRKKSYHYHIPAHTSNVSNTRHTPQTLHTAHSTQHTSSQIQRSTRVQHATSSLHFTATLRRLLQSAAQALHPSAQQFCQPAPCTPLLLPLLPDALC